MNLYLTRYAIATLLGFSLLSAAMANQPRDAGSKARGEIYNFWGARSGQTHAQDQARSIYYYGKTQQPLSAPQLQEHITGMRQSLTSCQRNLSELKKGNPDNKEAQAAITKIEAIHKKVLEHSDKLASEAAKEKSDSAAVCDCCVDIHSELEAANAEMSKLQKALKIDSLPTPKKANENAEPKK